MNVYIHTLNGKLAYFDRVERVVKPSKPSMVAHDLFVPDLNKIKQQQSMSMGKRYMFNDFHGYVRIQNVDSYIIHGTVSNV